MSIVAEWQSLKLQGHPLTGRSGHTAVLIGQYMYVFGGEDQNDKLLNDLIAVNIHTATVTYINTDHHTKPTPRHGHTAVSLGNYIYVFGGDDGTARLNDLWRINLNQQKGNHSWEEVKVSGDYMPPARTKHAAVKLSDSIMIVTGGWDCKLGEAYGDVWALLIHHSGDRVDWIDISTKCPKRIWAKADIGDQFMYLFAGEDEDDYLRGEIFKASVTALEDASTVQIEPVDGVKLNPELLKIEEVVSEHPGLRYGHSFVWVQDLQSFFVFGGYGGEMTMFADLWQYSPERKQWRKLKLARSNDLHGLDGHTAVVHGTSLYVFGGRTIEMTKLQNVLQIDVSKAGAAQWTDPHPTHAQWSCSACTFMNANDDVQCEICGFVKLD